ncbi:AMOP and von Willebrand factor and Sushi SCR CCP domain containing protein [Aphelenchoides fujianensis]|nr:AMOP and von Willebrand factor and Sushi SCR CCP domain containing protein [Aphelenchoides fujianensis]
MFTTGVGIRVHESRGLLNVIISLPDNYREVHVNEFRRYTDGYQPFEEDDSWSFSSLLGGTTTPSYWQNDANNLYGRCATHYRTLGLLGTYNGDSRDETTTPDCSIVPTSYPQSANDARQLYYQFGERWRLDRNHQLPRLFQVDVKPIYDPLSFANPRYEPNFDPWMYSNYSLFESFLFSLEEVKVACQGLPECEADTLNFGRREFGLDTLDFVKKFDPLRERAQTRRSSCGPLVKNRGVLKYPQGNNYLDGVTVTFTCKPEYFLHGDTQRTCINGTWSPGWWAWCRERSEEYALKWMTGILSSVAFLLAIIGIFVMCMAYGRQRQRLFIERKFPQVSFIPDSSTASSPNRPAARSPVADDFKGKQTRV